MENVIHEAIRSHEFCAGHRVYGHESKCAKLHGHGYVAHFHCEAGLDKLGRVLDFSVIKWRLCNWLEENWDHKMLLWSHDPLCQVIHRLEPDSIVGVPFNPTAENMAGFLLTVIGPQQLRDTGVILTKVIIEETRKCHASARFKGEREDEKYTGPEIQVHE